MLAAPTYGLVVCGGKSSRMGSDKSMIVYHHKPQAYYMYDMLLPLCRKVFLSCNMRQTHQYADRYNLLPDLPVYENIGPAAALLTAFNHYPDVNFLAAGCDFPFITNEELKNLLATGERKNTATALYNTIENIYEPLLAWYPAECLRGLGNLVEMEQYSIQQFLRATNAIKINPAHQKLIISVDTPEAFTAVKRQFR